MIILLLHINKYVEDIVLNIHYKIPDEFVNILHIKKILIDYKSFDEVINIIEYTYPRGICKYIIY